MTGVDSFGLTVLVAGAVLMAAVLANRVSASVRLPAAAIFLLGAALVSDIQPALYRLPFSAVELIVTVALVIILFDGGVEVGWQQFRRNASSAILLGVAGTVATAAAMATLAHTLFRLGWTESLLLGVALAPTDPVVVFSVLGARRLAGPSAIVLKGEAGLNDPVGIALLVSLLTAAASSGGVRLIDAATTFMLQMVVGALIGLVGGRLLLIFMRRVALPGEGLHPLRAVAAALVIYGAAATAHGSGFLAVFLAGIVTGDARVPYKAEVHQFIATLASFAEIVAFMTLGLTISLSSVLRSGAWAVGAVLAVLLAFLVRPVVIGLLLLPTSLRLKERAFVVWAGLKGAVPILLATFVVVARVPNAIRMYGIVFVVVAFSVIAQGTLTPLVASWLRLPTERVAAEN